MRCTAKFREKDVALMVCSLIRIQSVRCKCLLRRSCTLGETTLKRDFHSGHYSASVSYMICPPRTRDVCENDSGDDDNAKATRPRGTTAAKLSTVLSPPISATWQLTSSSGQRTQHATDLTCYIFRYCQTKASTPKPKQPTPRPYAASSWEQALYRTRKARPFPSCLSRCRSR